MNKEIIVAEGIFSKLSIQLKMETTQNLILTENKHNPLASVEKDLKKVLNDFEHRYFEMVYPGENHDPTNQ